MEQINYGIYIQNTITIILAIAGLITAIGGAIIMIQKLFSASQISKNAKEIAEHTKKIDLLDDRLSVLEENTNKQDEFKTVMCNSMLALLNHNINGNSIDKLEIAKDELKDYLIKSK